MSSSERVPTDSNPVPDRGTSAIGQTFEQRARGVG
jgi:hypothetical protein